MKPVGLPSFFAGSDFAKDPLRGLTLFEPLKEARRFQSGYYSPGGFFLPEPKRFIKPFKFRTTPLAPAPGFIFPFKPA
jgi:hypothetical protein